MILSVQQVKWELLSYLKEFGGGFDEWYVGIADDAKETLETRHGLVLDRDLWIFKQTLTHRAAQTVQEYFVRKLGTDGDIENIEPARREDFDCVYLFKKTDNVSDGRVDGASVGAES